MSLSSLFIKQLTLERRSDSSDGQGGFSHTLQPIISFRGRIRPASPQEQIVASKEQAIVDHVVYCFPALDIRLNDFIVDGDLRFQVMAIKRPSKLTHLELQCREDQEAE